MLIQKLFVTYFVLIGCCLGVNSSPVLAGRTGIPEPLTYRPRTIGFFPKESKLGYYNDQTGKVTIFFINEYDKVEYETRIMARALFLHVFAFKGSNGYFRLLMTDDPSEDIEFLTSSKEEERLTTGVQKARHSDWIVEVVQKLVNRHNHFALRSDAISGPVEERIVNIIRTREKELNHGYN
ncbi:hypothetical protein FB446DRAFT_706202 [Lentinula raphanica]|nr:hypothetical protein FB446DRAFT_706202 [Lentinula raphanica]